MRAAHHRDALVIHIRTASQAADVAGRHRQVLDEVHEQLNRLGRALKPYPQVPAIPVDAGDDRLAHTFKRGDHDLPTQEAEQFVDQEVPAVAAVDVAASASCCRAFRRKEFGVTQDQLLDEFRRHRHVPERRIW